MIDFNPSTGLANNSFKKEKGRHIHISSSYFDPSLLARTFWSDPTSSTGAGSSP